MLPYPLAEAPADAQSTLVGGGLVALVAAALIPLLRFWDKRADSADKQHADRETSLNKQIEAISTDNRGLHESLGGLRTQLQTYAEKLGALAAKVQILETQNSSLLADNQRLTTENHRMSIETVRLKGEINNLLEDCQKPARYTL